MMLDDPRSRFDLIAAELRVLGIGIRRLPGEYCVNFLRGGDKTARVADDLDQALELGRAMAAERPSESEPINKEPIGKQPRKWRRTKTRKALRRRFIRRHNRWMRARAIRKQRAST